MVENDYNEQVLETILSSTYSVDEFIRQTIDIEEQELIDSVNN